MAIPAIVLVAVLVYLSTIALATRDAMEQIFVTPVRPTYAAAATPALASEPPPGAPAEATPSPSAAGPVSTPLIEPEWQGTDRINVLLLGVDKRDRDEPPRSDTMILVSIDPVGKRVGMLSIPRDLWVTIPGHGPDKINAAYPLGEAKTPGGGPALAMQTIETNFRLPVHHFASVDFRGFVRIIDAVGGITVDVPYTLKDDEYPSDEGYNYTRLYVPVGLQHLDGQTALRYARSRHMDNDFGRQRRQQQVLQAVREQGLKLNLLPRLPEFITLLAGAVKTDFDPRQVPGLVRLGAGIERDSIRSYGVTLDMVSVHDSPTIFYLEPSWPKINAAIREMLGASPRPVATVAVASPTVRRPVATVAVASPTVVRPVATVTPVNTVPVVPTPTVVVEPTAPPARVRIWVRNGTTVNGLAARTAEQLRGRGYSIVDVSQDPAAGNYARSIVYTYGISRAQAAAIAQQMGLPATAVRLGPAPAPAGTDLLIILGDDAPR